LDVCDVNGPPASFRPVYERQRDQTERLLASARERNNLRLVDLLGPARLPVRQRASDESLRARLRAALDDNQRQRELIAGLREELAIAHGRVRELELDRRVRRG